MSASTLKVLFVASRMPSHLATGDRLRAYYFVKGLIQRGHQVDLLAFENRTCPRIETDIYGICHKVRPIYIDNLELQNQGRINQLKDMLAGIRHGLPRRVWQFHSTVMIEAFDEMASAANYDVIHFSDIGIAELVNRPNKEMAGARVFDLIDAVSMSVRSSLKYRIDISWFLRLVESYQLLRFEKMLLKEVDAAIVVSRIDQAFLNSPAKLHSVPIGIEIPEYAPTMDKEFDLLFVGNMSTTANTDAIHWFIKSIWPDILAQRPAATIYIVGRDPLPSISQLATDQVIVTGDVENVRWYFSRAKVFVAPVRFGAGQKIKILEAFASAVPVVATHEANKGIDAVDGESIIVRSDPAEMAQAILELLADEQRRHELGQNAYQFAKKNFAWERAVETLEALYHQTVQDVLRTSGQMVAAP